MEAEDLIVNYLQNSSTHMLQLATAANDQPWVCNVWFAADEKCNIYWFSSNTRRHSQEIQANSKVAGSICDPQNLADDAIALQFQGIAEELTMDVDIEAARKVYEGRVFDAERINKLLADPEKPHRFYRLKPTLFLLFDAVHFPDQPYQQWRP